MIYISNIINDKIRKYISDNCNDNTSIYDISCLNLIPDKIKNIYVTCVANSTFTMCFDMDTKYFNKHNNEYGYNYVSNIVDNNVSTTLHQVILDYVYEIKNNIKNNLLKYTQLLLHKKNN